MHGSNHNPDPVAVKRYCVYIWLGTTRYYANRSDSPPPHDVRWSTRDAEWPDYYTYQEVMAIKHAWSDQRVSYEEIYVVLEDNN